MVLAKQFETTKRRGEDATEDKIMKQEAYLIFPLRDCEWSEEHQRSDVSPS